MDAASLEQRALGIRLANIEVRSMIPERAEFDPDHQCEFFCECGKCRDLVQLLPKDFDRQVASDQPVLAPDHVFSAAAEARRVAGELREESEALRAEARQAVRRAQWLRQGRVLIVDDSADFRSAAASLVSVAPWLGLAGEAASGEEAIQLLPQRRPDLILLDVQMPGLNGVETARLIHRVHPNIVVVLISADTGRLSGVTHLLGPTALMNKSQLRPGLLDALWLKHRPRN